MGTLARGQGSLARNCASVNASAASASRGGAKNRSSLRSAGSRRSRSQVVLSGLRNVLLVELQRA